MVKGIHHITAISADPQNTYDFYTQVLGLRLVKKSVNQDDVQTYHLFFGDELASPGMDLTFFPFKPVAQGVHGAGMVNKIMLAVPKGALNFWVNRIKEYKLKFKPKTTNELGDDFIEFNDWDGQILQIVETDKLNIKGKPHLTSDINSTVAIRNFYGVEIAVDSLERSKIVLEQILDFKVKKETNSLAVFENKNSDFANLIFLKLSDIPALNAAGTVHHIAFRVANDEEQLKVRKKIIEYKLNPTEVIDRFYFKSVYFREPGGVLYEIATDGPGFDVDEPLDELGENLSLPPFIESKRDFIEENLIPIRSSLNVLEKSHLFALFKYTEIANDKSKTLFLLHGTGGDEYDLLPILNDKILAKYNVISLRGNVSENDMNRFFRRFEEGSYDQDSIKSEAEKLNEFITQYKDYSKIDFKNFAFLGFSNGANMILAMLMLYPQIMHKLVLLHPAMIMPDTKTPKFNHTSVLVTYGKYDNMITFAESKEVVDLLKQGGAEVQEFDNQGGHFITQRELGLINEFLED